jgi:hypothetical protein
MEERLRLVAPGRTDVEPVPEVRHRARPLQGHRCLRSERKLPSHRTAHGARERAPFGSPGQ